MLPLSTAFALPHFESLFYLTFFIYFSVAFSFPLLSTSSLSSATNMKANLHNNFCQLFFLQQNFLHIKVDIALVFFPHERIFPHIFSAYEVAVCAAALSVFCCLIKFNYFK